jgi:hypothetical protein
MHPLRHALEPRVAVLVRHGQHRPTTVEQREIDRPRIDADRDNPLPEGLNRQPQAVEDLAIKPEDVPVNAIRKFDSGIAEPVHLLHLHGCEVRPRRHHAATPGTQIHCYENAFAHLE